MSAADHMMPKLNDSERSAIEMAAAGCVSGALAEWPVLCSALNKLGVTTPPPPLQVACAIPAVASSSCPTVRTPISPLESCDPNVAVLPYAFLVGGRGRSGMFARHATAPATLAERT
jgi:hypothetical protein